jgi:hypothetical protein
MEQSPRKPSIADTLSAYTNAQIGSFNLETKDRLRSSMATFERLSASASIPTKMHFAQVSFDQIQLPEVKSFFNSLPTTLELDDDDVDRLIVAGRLLLRRDPSFKKFLARTDGRLIEGAISDEEIFQHFRDAGRGE